MQAIIRPKIGDLKPDEVGWEPSKEELVEIYGGQQHKKRLREVKVGQLREMKEAISASKKKVEALFDIVEVSAERLVQGLISSSIDIDVKRWSADNQAETLLGRAILTS